MRHQRPAGPLTAGLVLGIETATALGGVAVADAGGRILGEVTLLGAESHSERIVPEAGRLLEALGASPGDLAAVAVSTGPGSFTGLRSGLASAKGLALARGVPLYGVPTLEALAANAPPGAGAVCAVVNARRGELYRALFDAGERATVRLTPDELVAAPAFADGLPAGCLVLGEPPAGTGDAGRRWRCAPAWLNHPRAAVVALAGLAALRAGLPSRLADLVPSYVRPPDATFPAGAKEAQ